MVSNLERRLARLEEQATKAVEPALAGRVLARRICFLLARYLREEGEPKEEFVLAKFPGVLFPIIGDPQNPDIERLIRMYIPQHGYNLLALLRPLVDMQRYAKVAEAKVAADGGAGEP